MSAARLDPFSARLHAIHRRGARAKAPKPTLQEESAPEAATTGMPVREDEARRLFGHDDDDEPRIPRKEFEDEEQGSMSYVPVNDEEQGSMSYAPVNDEGQGSMSYVNQGDPRGSMSLSAMDEEHSIYGSEGPDDDDGAPKGYQAQIHELRRRLSALESEVVELKGRLGGA